MLGPDEPARPERTPIDDPDDERLAPYREMRDANVAKRHGLFIAEGRLVVPILLSVRSLYQPVSILGTPVALDALDPAVHHRLARSHPNLPIYEASQPVMDRVAGFAIHRGLVAAGRRREPQQTDTLFDKPDRSASAASRFVFAVEDLTNHDNLGGLFRNAAAFAADALLLSPRCCDHLYRKCVRVSMGHALTTPVATWSGGRRGVQQLRELGLFTIALTPDSSAPDIRDAIAELSAPKPDHALTARVQQIALLIGSEGEGLSTGAIHAADRRARIAMAPGLDSLNTAVAAAIAAREIAAAIGVLTRA